MLNRLVSSLVVASSLGALVPPATCAERSPSPFKGDVDGDHRLDANDLLRLRRALDGVVPLPPDAAFRADVDGDGSVTEIDFSMLTFPALDATSVPPFGEVAVGTPVVHAVSPPFAPPGATVVLEGEGFGRGPFANEVLIGDVVADVVSATADRIEFTAPDETGVVSVRNLESGLRGLSASFVVAASPQAEFDPSLPEGSVLLTTPDVVPQANDVFLVPLALAAGDVVPSVFHVRIAFDPEHVEAICLEPLQPEWFTPLPPCIDNAAGVLGAGALRVAISAAPPPGDPMPIFAIGFVVKTYRPHPPKLVVRVEAISGGPGDAPVGEKTPRFAVDTVQLHPAPSTPPGAREWLGNVADLPVLTSVSSSVGSSKTVLTVTGSGLPSGNGAGGCLAVLGDAVLVPSAKTPTSFQVTLPKAAASGPLVLVDLPTAGVSSDVVVVVPEGETPYVDEWGPEPGASFVSPLSDVRLVFSEALDGDALTYGRRVRLLVAPPGEFARPWPAATSTSTGGVTVTRLRPLLPFPAGATVRVEVDATVADLSGNGIAGPTAAEFLVTP